MAKGPYDDIVRKVLERLGANAPKATETVAKKAASTTGRRGASKAASVPAKPLTKAERSAANRAKAAADRAKVDAKLAAERPAKKAARTAEARAKGVARGNRKSEEAYGYGANQLKTNKAKAFYEREVDKLNRTIDATERLLSKGSQGRRDMLKKELEGFKKRFDLPKLSAGDSLGVVRDAVERAQKNNKWAKERLAQVVKQTEGKTGKEVVEMGARRARAIEIKTGKTLTGSKPARITSKMSETQKRLSALEEKRKFDAVIKKADSKMGPSRGPSNKPKKKVVEQESSKRLRAAQEKNVRKNVSKTEKMSPAERKKFLAKEFPKGGLTDSEAKDILMELGKREFVSDKRKLGGYPRIDRYGKRS